MKRMCCNQFGEPRINKLAKIIDNSENIENLHLRPSFLTACNCIVKLFRVWPNT